MAKKTRQENNQLVFEINKTNLNIVTSKGKKKKNKKKDRGEKVARVLQEKNSHWFKLDNAGTIYPSSKNEHWTFVFRISAVFKEEIDPEILQKSVDEVMPRFPSFDVYLKKGFFWHYFEPNPNRLIIEKEQNFPCSYINTADKSHLIRVIYSKYRLSLEVFHAVSDGHGALMLLNSIIARYIENSGCQLSSTTGFLDHRDLPSQDELEDSFLANSTGAKGKSHKESSAYNIPGTIENEGIVNVTHAILSVNEVKEVAKKHNCHLTIFLAAVFGYEIIRRRRNNPKPVKISIPIDMRKEFSSSTLRNFSTYINIPIEDETASLAEIIETIKTGMTGIDRGFMVNNINSNVNIQKNPFVKIVPLALKNPILSTSFNFLGENLQTFAFSNLGPVKVPGEFEKYIERYEVNLGRSKHNSIAVGLISFGDKLVITISSKLSENTTERDVIRELAQLGLNVKVETNRRDSYGG